MATAQTLVDNALKLLGQLEPGKSLSGTEASDALAILNQMLDSWNTESLSVYQIIEEAFTWPAGTTSRTIGPTGDFVTTRPVELSDSTFFRDTRPTPNVDYPLDIINNAQYDSIPIKTIQSTFPQSIFCDQAMPNATLYLWPVPSISVQLWVNSVKQLAAFAALSTAVTLPPGYERALSYNLACEIAPFYQMEPPNTVQRIASVSKRNINRVNAQNDVLDVPVNLVQRQSRFNIYTGDA